MTPGIFGSTTLTLPQDQAPAEPVEHRLVALYRTFDERVEDAAIELFKARLVPQEEVQQFLAKYKETAPHGPGKVAWVLCKLISDVIECAINQTQDIQRKRELKPYYRLFESLLKEILPQGTTVEAYIKRFKDYKDLKDIQDQRLVDTAEIAYLKLQEACQFANGINDGIRANLENYLRCIRQVNAKRQTLRPELQKRLDEISELVNPLLQGIQQLTLGQGEVAQGLKDEKQTSELVLQAADKLAQRIQKL